MAVEITREALREKIAALALAPATSESEFYLTLMQRLLDEWPRTPFAANALPAIRLPYCSASPVCEIEAGYAAGVSDCREAIRQAGYPIEGDE